MYKLPTKYIVIAIVAVLAFVGIAMFGMPIYRVWSQEMRGKAQLAEAEQNRRIKVEEARANLEAEKLNAKAEIERAKGAAEAIKIENGTLTQTYIQYLWVRNQNNLNEKTVIYIPTEANLPILEAGRRGGGLPTAQ
ncbi:MAG: hypothetical protein UIG52_00800 [Bacteroidales bacterium]|jgi:hypothetical protein|nr:hypothetical protein [Bacteroidales bacterium]MEE0948347.1 hypothetical protein [Bacteroidales bacterium]MEE0992100.1 hypothetical protein [Bacteroidales bacterium]MEE1000462.1 hypothetical protein [Bacteroidales bacterium]MEE1097332.1 hypothetical protein [Bacteroidales bacterium]